MRQLLSLFVVSVWATSVVRADESTIAVMVNGRPTKLASFSAYTSRRASALAVESGGAFFAGGGGTVIKCDGQGKMIWKTVVGTAEDEITALKASLGGVYVACTRNYRGKDKFPVAFQLGKSGRIVWKAKLERFRDAEYVTDDGGGNCFVSGHTKSGELFVTHLDAKGVAQWHKELKAPKISDDEAASADADENFYAFFAVKGGRLVLTYPFQADSKHTFYELDLRSGALLKSYTKVWNGAVNLPWSAKDGKGREYVIRDSG
ncbi:MAG: hypothetical protein HZB70_00035 [Candidatus Berkelbacteria bacterium]|nr:MAG: hypothetical protein HZB70_00035 [Candidatus Berkelbacteria bacterium]QQG51498.1 MAG: hypothetical protein HY845_02965 [Candidatus Berkelbacteria bacterium]